MVSALEGFNDWESWVPRGQMFDASIRLAFALSRQPAGRSDAWALELNSDQIIHVTDLAVADARAAAHQQTMENLIADLHDPADERAQVIEQLEELHKERSADRGKRTSDALYYWLVLVGLKWSVEHEQIPPLDLDHERLIGKGLAADLRICEPVSPVLFDMLWAVDQSTGGPLQDIDVRGAFEAVFFDEDEVEDLLGGCQILDDAVMQVVQLDQSMGQTIRDMMIDRWEKRTAGGRYPWGEESPCLIPDPLQLGSTHQLDPPPELNTRPE